MPVGALAPGRTIRFTVTREDRAPGREFEFVYHSFASWAPFGNSHLVVYAEPSRFAFKTTGDVSQTTADGHTVFSVGARPAVRLEPRQAPFEEFVPSVRLGPMGATWESCARECRDEIQPRLEPDAKVKELARSLTAGLTGADDKVRAIARHVQETCTYKALAFGPRARVPSPAAEIITNRYGDCKDHSLLAHLLLREAGIQSWLALISARSSADRELPSLAPFDHMVVYLGNDRFMDLTDKSSDPTATPPIWLAGRTALILDREQPKLIDVPRHAPVSGNISSVRDAELQGRDLVVRETLTATGPSASELRAIVQGVERGDMVETISRVIGRGDVEVQEAAVRGAADTSAPLVLTLKYRSPGAVIDTGRRLAVTLPYPWERWHLAPPHQGERSTPFEHLWGTQIDATVRLKAADKPVNVKSLNFEKTTPHVTVARRVESVLSQSREARELER